MLSCFHVVFFFMFIFCCLDFCATKTNGLHKKMGDCSEFYQCFEGQTYLLQCPKGTLYNDESKICDWAENVDCGDDADTTADDKTGIVSNSLCYRCN